MGARGVAAILPLLLVWPTPGHSQRAAAPDPLLAIFHAYESGDIAAIPRALRSTSDHPAIRRSLASVLAEWQVEPFSPVRATFLLELLTAAIDANWSERRLLVDAAARMVTSRPDDPRFDPYERTYHRTMAALLAGKVTHDDATSYISKHLRRADSLAARLGDGRADRLLRYALAMVREARTTPGLAVRSGGRPFTLSVAQADDFARQRVEQALTGYEDLPDSPEFGQESLVRRAFLLARLGRHAEASRMIERFDDTERDSVVRYWAALFRGRIRESLRDPRGAEEAYRRALTEAPGAQSASVALAALLFRQNRHDEARNVAPAQHVGRTLPPDPWWLYWSGHLRHVGAWLDQLRATRG